MANMLLSSGLEAAQMAYQHKCREEDMIHRKIENQRRLIDNARRKVDKKAAQLKAISHLAALIAGFSMVVLVEAQVGDDVPTILVAAFGLSAACVIGLMLMAMLNCTLMLVIILKHDCSQPTGSALTPTQMFLDFWETRCEEDWQTSFKQFRLGIPAFLFNLTMLGWVKFWHNPLAASLVTVVAFVVTGAWLLHTRIKWGRAKASSQPAPHTGPGERDMRRGRAGGRPTLSMDGMSPAPSPGQGSPDPRWRGNGHDRGLGMSQSSFGASGRSSGPPPSVNTDDLSVGSAHTADESVLTADEDASAGRGAGSRV